MTNAYQPNVSEQVALYEATDGREGARLDGRPAGDGVATHTAVVGRKHARQARAVVESVISEISARYFRRWYPRSRSIPALSRPAGVR
jgi:hypothetical protein